MTVEEVQAMKAKLREDIHVLLHQFEEATNLSVLAIHVNRVDLRRTFRAATPVYAPTRHDTAIGSVDVEVAL